MQVQQINRMRGMLEDELAQKQRDMASSTKQSNVMLKQQFFDKNRADHDNFVNEEIVDYDNQTQIRVVPSYFNPLPDAVYQPK
jgi:hypothetical protein